ncbi:MAG: NADH-quinone oxidoreductase subunit N [Pirellulales bacterium]
MSLTLSEFVKRLLDGDSSTQGLTASLSLFRPELTICATIVALLVMRIFFRPCANDAFVIAFGGCLIGLYYALPGSFDTAALGGGERTELFAGLLVYDRFTVFFRGLLLAFGLLLIVLCRLTGIPDGEDAPDFFTLMLGATLGMCVMSLANHLLMVFMGIEMASVPSYAMAGLLKGRRQSSEAALKYAVYGAGTAGIMLYGISLLAGVLGTLRFPEMAVKLAALAQAGGEAGLGDSAMVLALGGLMLMVGLAFKLSAVPFHFWCPDVFTGASAEVNAFLSIASKAAAFAILIRVAVGIGYGSDPRPVVEPMKIALTSVSAEPPTPATVVRTASREAEAAPPKPIVSSMSKEQRVATLAPVRLFMVWVLAVLAMVTCTFGNLAAYGQTNIKRMLAYSTIAHAGYMLMGVTAGVALMGRDDGLAEIAFAAVPFYLATYLFTNLVAFGSIAFLRNTLKSEDYRSYAGMIRVNPGVVICLSLALISLVGLPPLAGFAGKCNCSSAWFRRSRSRPTSKRCWS